MDDYASIGPHRPCARHVPLPLELGWAFGEYEAHHPKPGMIMRALFILLLLLPVMALAQGPVPQEPTVPNATMLALLKAQRPPGIEEEQWLKMMQEPVNRAHFPIRLTQAMLDTLDARKLDQRYQYVMVRE
jgi:hypothetical protein